VTSSTGRIIEDERVFGCMEFSIRSQAKAIMGESWPASSHTDGVLLKPTILLVGRFLKKMADTNYPKLKKFAEN